jgi:hypothetical protein
MDWTNPIDPVKLTQSNSKKWVGLDKWVNIDFKNEKPIKKIGLRVKPDLNPRKPTDPLVLYFLKYFYENTKNFVI